MYQPTIVARKWVITVILSVLAGLLFILGASPSPGVDMHMVQAIYFSGAAIVFAIAIIPWMTKE